MMGVVKLGPTMCKTKRCICTFQAVDAGLVHAHTKTDIGMCTYQNILFSVPNKKIPEQY